MDLPMTPSETPLSKLERGVRVGVEVLDKIAAVLGRRRGHPEISHWVKSIKNVQNKARKPKTVIGVVGATGAGKSSIINAILDEECLVPTNCKRACTAVITELQYNHSDDPKEKYRAEVHFISKDDWVAELKILLDYTKSVDGQMDFGSSNDDTEVRIAYSKIRSVHPNLTNESILKSGFTIQSLVEEIGVAEDFGTIKKISASSIDELGNELLKFIDSKEKKAELEEKEALMEYWPLIKVVKIFVKASVLESGLVLVDLPGVKDSNAARSAVASKYIEQCTGLWVVAPIERAVDDGAAKELMGASFKRQLQLDGTYSNVTIICSKTDSISMTEILKKRSTHDEPNETQKLHGLQKEKEAELEGIKKKYVPIEQKMKILTKQMEELDVEIDCFETAIAQAEDESEVRIVSPVKTKKRKPRAAGLKCRKRTQTMHLGDDDSGSSSEKDGLSKNLKLLRKATKELEKETKRLKFQTKRVGIQSQDKYVKAAMKRQFVNGIRELDIEIQALAEKDGLDFEVRDYLKMANGLRVFCVSSKAYQLMSGRLDKDDPISGFADFEDTEIPELRRHGLETTRTARVEAYKRFFRELSQILAFLYIQVVVADQPSKWAEDLKKRETWFFLENIAELRKDGNTIIRRSLDKCRELVRRKVTERFPRAAGSACKAAVVTMAGWFRPSQVGGLPFQTFRAICVRGGVFDESRRGPLDLNEDLIRPLKTELAGRWEQTFSTGIPECLSILVEELANRLDSFGTLMKTRPELAQLPSFRLVARQMETAKLNVRNTADMGAVIKAGQREANRLFTPTISEEMASTYSACSEEQGQGCYKRIKDIMTAHMNHARYTMFDVAASRVNERLEDMFAELEELLQTHVATVIDAVDQDYFALVANESLFKVLKGARNEIHGLLSQCNAGFKQVIEAQGPNPDVNAPDETDPEVKKEDSSMLT
ncbi:hypothetical protein B0T24DRAFT_655432 [Lasiosphaeria ovina]|uniref:Tat pathway signal sequence n=1 Tax=Lasiosphaeria ovina TaxID=92902 RepID=A0AAE0TSX3_9PEZI|nr:hypothetical protein B0T24DRAFT_655432 [Lasiosphaeria ovina]